MIRLERKHFYIFGLFLTFIAGSIFTTFIIQVFAHGGDTSLIHGCIDGRGNVAKVGESENCLTGETAVDWSKQFEAEDLPFICTGCDLSSSNQIVETASLVNAVLTNSNLSTNDFENMNFTGAKLTYGSLESTTLIDANFTGADLRFTSMGSADATGANFTGSNLEGAANMDMATLTGATWSNTICPDGTNSNSHSNTCEGYLTP